MPSIALEVRKLKIVLCSLVAVSLDRARCHRKEATVHCCGYERNR